MATRRAAGFAGATGHNPILQTPAGRLGAALPQRAQVATVKLVRVGKKIVAVVSLAAVLGCWPWSRASAQAGHPEDLFRALNRLRTNTKEVYYIRNLRLRHDAVRFNFEEGKLAFLAAYDGKLTGAVFTGRGRALALPRDPVEKQQLARFLGAPLLDQPFTSAYLRFTDSTAEELLAQLKESGAEASDEPSFAEEWDETISNLNPWHSLRILTDWLAAVPRPYFYAGLLGETTGAFDVLVDERRAEQVLIGQPRWVAGQRYFDVWTSFRRTDSSERLAPPFRALSFSIETTIRPDLVLEGTARITAKAERGTERAVPLELSRFLVVKSVQDADGKLLPFFQNAAVNRHEIAERGNDSLIVILPAVAKAGEELKLRVVYQGSVIADAGNGVYFVGDRGSWYPHFSGASEFAPVELSLRWPHRLQLVATGRKLEQHEEGEWRTGRWRSEGPIPVAGFNLGEYASETVESEGLQIQLYANRQLEQFLQERFRRQQSDPRLPMGSGLGSQHPHARSTVIIPEVTPSPASLLRELGGEIADAARYFERFNGRFPYPSLAVSQIPGAFGQGWPGLLYLSTFAFLSPRDQQRAGLTERAQEQFTDLVPFHEVAHQWWGDLVSWESYHDQWIQEGLANYIALLYADSKKNPERTLAGWLERYRKELAAKEAGVNVPAESAGPLVLGYRLRCSRSPAAFDRIVYGKGTWVFHMLRMMLRDPAAAANPAGADARFAQLLQRLLEAHRYHALSTDDLQKAVESVMTPAMALEGGRSMDWFFDQWVRGTGLPRYSVEFTVQPKGAQFVMRGTLKQAGVPETFLAAVPLYAARPGGKPVLLGTVVTSGAETPFQFVTPLRPRRLLIDPQQTLLCQTQ